MDDKYKNLHKLANEFDEFKRYTKKMLNVLREEINTFRAEQEAINADFEQRLTDGDPNV